MNKDTQTKLERLKELQNTIDAANAEIEAILSGGAKNKSAKKHIHHNRHIFTVKEMVIAELGKETEPFSLEEVCSAIKNEHGIALNPKTVAACLSKLKSAGLVESSSRGYWKATAEALHIKNLTKTA